MTPSPEAATQPRKVDAGRGWTWIAEAFAMFMEAPGMWIGITVIYMIIVIGAAAIPGASLLTSLFGPVFSGGLILACSSQASGQGVKIEHLFAGFRGSHFGPLVLLAVIYMGAMLAAVIFCALIALLGFGLSPVHLSRLHAEGIPDEYILPMLMVLLIMVALIIPIMMGMWLAPALIVLRGHTPVDAFKLSFKACLINFLPFLVYGIVTLLIAVVATIPLLLGWLVAAPVFVISIYTAWRDMFPPPPLPQPDFGATQPIAPPPLI